MTEEEIKKLEQTVDYFGHWYDVIGEERIAILEKAVVELHEGQPKWHDLRKDPNDLPKGDFIYFYKDALGNPSCTLSNATQFIAGVESFFKNNQQIIAWCEIPQFKE